MGVTERKNVIVVGAGASKEFGLPTGAELTKQIARISDIRFDMRVGLESGDYEIVETLRLLASQKNSTRHDINPYLDAAWRIRDNMPLAPSIDNFLDTHRNDAHIVEFGKLAIAKAISDAEESSKIYIDHNVRNPKLKLSNLDKTWMMRLFKILVSQRDFASFKTALSNIKFISFNYDRCIEHFIVNAAKSCFNLESNEVLDLPNYINVIFPYGSLGALSWIDHSRNGFGEGLGHSRLIEVSQGLRTFTEGSDSGVIDEIGESLFEADAVMFLGFGFLPLNMDLLKTGSPHEVATIIGTGKRPIERLHF